MEKLESLVDLNTKISYNDDAIVLISQDGCAKCDILKNILPEFEKTGDITKPIFSLNLDDEDVDRELAIEKFNVMSTPLLLCFKNGELKVTLEGDDVNPMKFKDLENI